MFLRMCRHGLLNIVHESADEDEHKKLLSKLGKFPINKFCRKENYCVKSGSGVSLSVHSNGRKIRTRKTPNANTFYAVKKSEIYKGTFL